MDFYPKDNSLLYITNVIGTENLLKASVNNIDFDLIENQFYNTTTSNNNTATTIDYNIKYKKDNKSQRLIDRFIYCSSTETMGGKVPSDGVPRSEADDGTSTPNFYYGTSKREAEDVVRQFGSTYQLDYIILRPTGIYGKNDDFSLFELIQAVSYGLMFFIPSFASGSVMYTHVDDIVQSILLSISKKKDIQINTSRPDKGMSYRDCIVFLNEKLNRMKPRLELPFGIVSPVITCVGSIMYLFKKKQFLYKPDTLERMKEDRIFNIQRAKRELGYRPQYTLKQGLNVTVEEYLENERISYYPMSPLLIFTNLSLKAVDWAFSHGLTMIKKPTQSEIDNKVTTVTHLPFSLLPSSLDEKLLHQSIQLSTDFNLLVHNIAKDFNYLQSTLKNVPDQFTQNLLNIHRIVEEEGVKQPVTLGIFRSDYMIHQPTDNDNDSKLYQVELNTISSSFGSLSSKVFDLHRFLIGSNQLSEYDYHLDRLPQNRSAKNIADTIAKAFKLYNNPKAVVMMIVQDGERNIFDQKFIEYNLWNDHGVRMIRKTLREVNDGAKLDGSGKLVIDGEEIAISYYRAGYTPTDYHGQEEWDARLLIERSRSIKCPTISNHLVGAKKIQQDICRPGVLERFIEDKEISERMRRSFTGLYSLSKLDIDQDIVKRAIANPNGFVMKPQREGGGNNIYNSGVRHALETMSPDELSSYILMDKIEARPFKTHIVRDRELIEIEALYELGIFGLYISTDKNSIHLNEPGGLLLRTKTSSSDEGGVAAGFAVIDSIILK
eukprot:gene8574-10547_t